MSGESTREFMTACEVRQRREHHSVMTGATTRPLIPLAALNERFPCLRVSATQRMGSGCPLTFWHTGRESEHGLVTNGVDRRRAADRVGRARVASVCVCATQTVLPHCGTKREQAAKNSEWRAGPCNARSVPLGALGWTLCGSPGVSLRRPAERGGNRVGRATGDHVTVPAVVFAQSEPDRSDSGSSPNVVRLTVATIPRLLTFLRPSNRS